AGSASADAQKTAADRTAAESAKEAAEAAQQEAETAADTATGAAESAAESAETAIQYSGKPPRPQDGTWWVWDADAQEYRDTGIKSVLSIVKSYPSIDAMERDFPNMQEGDLVIIASSVGDEDNSKLFVHGGAAWVYLSDLSGLQGVGIASWERTSGDGSPGSTDTYTITLTDGRTFAYPVYNGRNGEGAGDVLGVPFSLELPAGGWSVTASVPVTVSAVPLPVPAQAGALTYNGSAQSPIWNGYDPDKMTLGGDTAATEPGSHAATFTPTPNYQWADGSTGIVAACITFFGAELGLACLTKIFGERNENHE
ncbi:MAG: hypothetical protein HFH27_11415, partial [Clostridiaceae bacterium]|nr:hypothetical protein [Clostridiaceae bacterium]